MFTNIVLSLAVVSGFLAILAYIMFEVGAVPLYTAFITVNILVCAVSIIMILLIAIWSDDA